MPSLLSVSLTLLLPAHTHMRRRSWVKSSQVVIYNGMWMWRLKLSAITWYYEGKHDVVTKLGHQISAEWSAANTTIWYIQQHIVALNNNTALNSLPFRVTHASHSKATFFNTQYNSESYVSLCMDFRWKKYSYWYILKYNLWVINNAEGNKLVTFAYCHLDITHFSLYLGQIMQIGRGFIFTVISFDTFME